MNIIHTKKWARPVFRLAPLSYITLSQGPKMLGPHNWAILYHMNDRTRRLFDRWRTLQIDYARDGTDQVGQFLPEPRAPTLLPVYPAGRVS